MTAAIQREWFSAAELADMGLPDMPASARGCELLSNRNDWRRAEWEGTRWRKRQGRGGGVEYHVSVLPRTAQIKLLFDAARPPAAPADATGDRAGMWRWFERLPAHKQDEARRRLEALDAVATLVRRGVKKVFAAEQVAKMWNVAPSGLYRWEALVHGIELADRLPYLAPKHAGRPSQADCTPEAWEVFKADYLRPERPNLTDCYDRVVRAAQVRGWTN